MSYLNGKKLFVAKEYVADRVGEDDWMITVEVTVVSDIFYSNSNEPASDCTDSYITVMTKEGQFYNVCLGLCEFAGER